jgi:hypothetical protein
MTTIGFVSPVVAFRDLLLDLATDTQLEGIPVRTVKRDPGDEPPFLLVAEGGGIRHRTGPAYAPARASLTAFHMTDREAADLYLAASELLHRLRPGIRDGVGIFKVFDETGLQQPFQDPDTGWWRAFGVFDLVLVDRLIT